MPQKTVVLAYSGGLDSSCMLRWLAERGHRVVAFIADVGQRQDLAQQAEDARRLGASDVVVQDLRRAFVTDYIYAAIAGRAVYEGRYLLGSALSRPLMAKAQLGVARRVGAQAVAHGATVRGNDQARFEFAYAALAPDLEVIAPWKDPAFCAQFPDRKAVRAYAVAHGLTLTPRHERAYNSDTNLMHVSYESGSLADPWQRVDPSIFTLCRSPKDAPEQEVLLDITFQNGHPLTVHNLADGHKEREPLALFSYLNALGGLHGVGRIDMVENRFIGIKSRGVYESPGGTLLHLALRDLEAIAMDVRVARLRDMLAVPYAEAIYNGLWFSPEMAFLAAAMGQARAMINGTVTLALYRGHATPVRRTSPSSLYNADLLDLNAAADVERADAQGFIRLHAMRLRAHGMASQAGGHPLERS